MPTRRKAGRLWIMAGGAAGLFVLLGLLVLWLVGPVLVPAILLTPAQVYPSAPTMPPPVPDAVEDLLSDHEAFLAARCPTVLSALRPGLTDAQINSLEAHHGIRLTDDLRALYRWRNGAPPRANVDVFPNHQFLPLDYALALRSSHRHQAAAQSAVERKVYSAVAGHRDPWVGLIVDAAGDGFFYDPTRSEPQGSFFFNFAEDGTYIFYPTFRNYLAAVVDGEKTGIFAPGPRGVDTNDFVRAQSLWQRFGASP